MNKPILLKTSDGPILIYAMEAPDHERAAAAFKQSKLAIDIEHKQVMKQVLAGKADVELLYECVGKAGQPVEIRCLPGLLSATRKVRGICRVPRRIARLSCCDDLLQLEPESEMHWRVARRSLIASYGYWIGSVNG